LTHYERRLYTLDASDLVDEIHRLEIERDGLIDATMNRDAEIEKHTIENVKLRREIAYLRSCVANYESSVCRYVAKVVCLEGALEECYAGLLKAARVLWARP